MVIFFIFIILIILLFIFLDDDIENMESKCPKQSTATENTLANTQNAKEACAKISTRAEEV